MAIAYYERKTNERMLGLIDTMNLSMELNTRGELNGHRAICYVFTPQTKGEDLNRLVSAASKCFRKAKVFTGRGAYREYAKEITYPTVYVKFTGELK